GRRWIAGTLLILGAADRGVAGALAGERGDFLIAEDADAADDQGDDQKQKHRADHGELDECCATAAWDSETHGGVLLQVSRADGRGGGGAGGVRPPRAASSSRTAASTSPPPLLPRPLQKAWGVAR